MLSALYAIARPSVCLSVTRVYHRKTVEVRITKFSPYGSPIHLVFARFHPEILRGPPNGGVKQGKISSFYLRDAMLARVIVIATCLSVRPSVCHAPVLCQNEES